MAEQSARRGSPYFTDQQLQATYNTLVSLLERKNAHGKGNAIKREELRNMAIEIEQGKGRIDSVLKLIGENYFSSQEKVIKRGYILGEKHLHFWLESAIQSQLSIPELEKLIQGLHSAKVEVSIATEALFSMQAASTKWPTATSALEKLSLVSPEHRTDMVTSSMKEVETKLWSHVKKLAEEICTTKELLIKTINVHQIYADEGDEGEKQKLLSSEVKQAVLLLENVSSRLEETKLDEPGLINEVADLIKEIKIADASTEWEEFTNAEGTEYYSNKLAPEQAKKVAAQPTVTKAAAASAVTIPSNVSIADAVGMPMSKLSTASLPVQPVSASIVVNSVAMDATTTATKNSDENSSFPNTAAPLDGAPAQDFEKT